VRVLGRIAMIVAAVGALAPLGAGRPAAAADPNAWTATEVYIPSTDGVRLHTFVFRPANLPAGKKTPVILNVSPYNTSGAEPLSPTDVANDPAPSPGGFPLSAKVFEHGYSYMEVALRGYGASTGCYDEGGPGERADVKAAVEWAADQKWSTGRVGMIGHSYDGQTQLMALGMHPRGLAAVVPSAPPAGYVNFFDDGVSNVTGRAFGAFYLVSDLQGPSLKAPVEHHVNALNGPLSYPACYPQTEIGTFNNKPQSQYWRDRDLAAKAAGSTIPTLWEQGFDDFNVRPSSFLPLWSTLRGPKRAFIGPWTHGIGPPNPETLRFLDAYVKQDPAALAYEASAPAVTIQEPDGRWRTEKSWPPADTVTRYLGIRSGSYIDGGVNASESEPPSAVTEVTGDLPVPLPTGHGTWTFSSPVTREVHLAGTARVRAHVRSILSNSTLIALLYDIDPAGQARFIARGGHLLRTAGGQDASVTLYPNDWRIAPGHRIGLLLTGDDGLWFEAGKSQLPVRVLSGSLLLPVVSHPRTTFIASGPYKVAHQPAPFTVAADLIARRTAGPLSP